MKIATYFFICAVLAVLAISLDNPTLAKPRKFTFDVEIDVTYEVRSLGIFDQIWYYQYTLTFVDHPCRIQKAISHWCLQLSACCDKDDLVDVSASPDSWSMEKPWFNERVLGYKICGIKWNAGGNYNSGTFTFSFYSLGNPTEVPWYAKNGRRFTDQGTTWGPNCDEPIAVELTSFAAEVTGGAVILTWSTATETENLGYHLYRSLEETGEYARINSELIAGAGTSEQACNYTYIDRNVEPGNTYYYKLADVDFNGNITLHGPISVTVGAVPKAYTLEQNYPNPFNPKTAINFALKEAGQVTLKIYNLDGQLVRTLVDEEKLAGSYSVMWNGTDEQGAKAASGTYLYTLKVNGFEETKKLVFIK